jgi:hypothetical protein
VTLLEFDLNKYPLKIPLTLIAMVLFWTVCAPCSFASTHSCVSAPERSYDVVPAWWITADGKIPPGTAGRLGQAFIFPSLNAPDEAPADFSFEVDDFFRSGNKFPQDAQFTWSEDGVCPVKIEVQRTNGAPAKATFIISKTSMTDLQYLRWEEFRNLERHFKHWLLNRSGCFLFTDRGKLFADLDSKLRTIWKTEILKQADFSGFSDRYLNTPKQFAISYPDSGNVDGLKGHGKMWVTPLAPRETVSITWGASTVYPSNPVDPAAEQGILGGYSRLSVGGRTDLAVAQYSYWLALLPPGTQKITEEAEGTAPRDVQTGTFPFSPKWTSLFGTTFVPIYNSLDLYSDRLLRGQPTFLFLLSPANYIKSDANGGKAESVQFATDARIGKGAEGVAGALQLTRRYIILGCDKNEPAEVENELGRLLDAAAHASDATLPVAKPVAYTMGVFMNQTFVEVLRHVVIDGHPMETPLPRLETWGGVVGTFMLPVLLSDSVAGSPAPLEVKRIVSLSVGASDDTRLKVMRIRFHTTEQSVLDAAAIGEGDEFNARAQVSKVLRQ